MENEPVDPFGAVPAQALLSPLTLETVTIKPKAHSKLVSTEARSDVCLSLLVCSGVFLLMLPQTPFPSGHWPLPYCSFVHSCHWSGHKYVL